MACIGNMPSFKYVTVESLVITYNGTPYPIKAFVTNKKYIVWNIDRPYQLEDSNVRPETSLLEYLIVINDNGKPTIVEHDELTYSFNQKTNGSNLTNSTEYNALKSEVKDNSTKFNLISNTVGDMTQIIGATEELEDGSIIYNLNKVKSDSESYGISIGEIETKIDDKYAEIKPIILNDLVEYLRSVSEYKLSFTNLLEDTFIVRDEFISIDTTKYIMLEKSNKLQTTLSDLKIIVDSVNDSEKSQLVVDMKNKLSTLQNALVTICDSYLQDSKISGEEKTNIIQKTYELTTYIGTVQNTCSNITVNGQAGVVYSIENELLILKDKTTSSIKELDRSNGSLTEKYSKLEQTSGQLSGKVSEIKTSVENKSNQDKQNIRCNDLGAKINYSAFNDTNNGEIYLHGYDINNNPTDTNGILYWNGTEIHVTKGMINPDGNFGTNDCYLCTDLSGGTFVAYYSNGWKYKWLIGATASGDLNIGDNYICFGQFKMNDSESFQYAHLFSSPIKLENAIGMSTIETRVKTAESTLTADGLTTIIGSRYTTSNDVDGIVTSKGYQTSSQVQQTVDKFEVKFTESGGYNLLKNSAFKNGYANWNYLRWDNTAGGDAYIETVYPQYNEWTPSNRNSLGACVVGLPSASVGVPLRAGFDSHMFNVKPNTTYTLNCLMACHRAYSWIIEMICYDSNGNRLTDDNHSVQIDNNNYYGGRDRSHWKKINHTWTTQSNAVTCHFRAFMNGWDGYYNSAYLWICEPIIVEGNVNTFWTPNADEVYTGITTIDDEGVIVDMIDGETSRGYSRLAYNGIATYDNAGNTKSWFSDSNAFIKDLTVDNINNPYLIQCRPRVTNWYVGQYSTGDGHGRDYYNKSNSIQSIFEYIKNSYGCYSNRQDINIYCDNGMSLNENIYIGGWLGSGEINISFGSNSTFVGTILVEECIGHVHLEGGRTGFDNNDGCMWYRTDGILNGSALGVRNSSVTCNGFRIHNNYSTYGYPFVTAFHGSSVSLYANDFVKFWAICRISVNSTVYIHANRGDIGTLCEYSDSGTLVGNSWLPICDSGKEPQNFYNSFGQWNGSDTLNSLWYPKYIPSEPEPVQPPAPTQSWHWVEKTFYFNLSSTVEDPGVTTSPWSGKWGQGRWSSYKPHRGHAVPTESISSWCNVGSNTRNISMVLTMTRLSTEHGKYGAVPIPKIKQKDGSYWNCGVAFALGNTKSLTLSSGVVSGLADGSLSEITMWAGTSTDDYSQYNNTSLTVTCEKYY